ncbi:RICIN domain-containing protein [Allostreptomyces psammosilenae]|uniref:RICIN domain-containing protein n=1 Tax=Allostreptomyces psammosilenae TaxID=1892865 RepID=UPI0035E439F0
MYLTARGTAPTVDYVTLRNVNSGKCLDVDAASTADGANVQLWTCNGGTNQQFEVRPTSNGYAQLVARHSGKLVDVASATDGANVTQMPDNGTTRQHWGLADVGNGQVRVINRHSGSVLDVANCGTADGTNVQQWSWLDNTCQRFTVVPVG